MSIRKIARRAKKTYGGGVRLAANTVNTVMKPTTKALRLVAKRAPVAGRPLTHLAGVPRRFTRGATNVIIALPNAAGRVTGTGFKVAKHAMLDPLLALGAGPPLVALGLSPSGKPKRITQKKKPKSRGKK